MMTTTTDQVFVLFRVFLLPSPHITKINDKTLSLKDFAVTEFNEMLSGRQQRQDVKVFEVSVTNSVLVFRVCWWFGNTNTP
jgi:hypothetical protein